MKARLCDLLRKRCTGSMCRHACLQYQIQKSFAEVVWRSDFVSECSSFHFGCLLVVVMYGNGSGVSDLDTPFFLSKPP